MSYYYLTTLDDEFKHYGNGKVTLATLLYIINRYVPLANAIYQAPFSDFSTNRVRTMFLSSPKPIADVALQEMYVYD